MIKQHRINPSTGLIPDEPSTPNDPWIAAKVAGSSNYVAHAPWEEEKFQQALVDWTILHDVSFATASAATTRGLLTWNRLNLLRALPDCRTTISSYVTKGLNDRKREVSALIESAQSKISVSVDVWTSRNHYSFLAIVAHFVGKVYSIYQHELSLT